MQQNPRLPEPGGSEVESLSPVEQATLLKVAREAVGAAVRRTPEPRLTPEAITPALVIPRACFVTLRQHGELRGCIGQLTAREPLWQAVVNHAQGAAVRDFRFSPVEPQDVDGLRIEISVLSAAQPLRYDSPKQMLDQLRPGVDGVVLRIGDRVSTFLPQVWEELPAKEQFMDHLARKAGCEAQAWRGNDVVVEVYQVHHFLEP